MADHYVRWLIAGGNAFRPAAASILKLVERLQKEKFLPTSGGVAISTIESEQHEDKDVEKARRQPLPAALVAWLKSGDGEEGERDEVRLVWPVADAAAAGLRYPLNQAPAGAAGYALEVHRADSYVYPSAENIGKVPTLCNCKEDQAFEWDEDEVVAAFDSSTGIFAECEACSRTFEPNKGTAMIGDPFGGPKEEVRGGAAYRFALVAVCDAWTPDSSLRFAPELVQILESEFGRTFYEVGALI